MEHDRHPRPPRLQARTALVVDDDDGCRLVVEQVLEFDGWRPNGASTLAAARAHLRAHGTPDLVVVDLVLPDGSGAELLATVREAPPSRPVAVVLCTGLPPDDLPSVNGEPGWSDVIEKPFDTDELLVRCRRAHEQAARGHPNGWEQAE